MTIDRFQQLWTDYLEGELGEAELAELRQLLENDPQLAEAAADSYQLHRLLGIAACDDPAACDTFVRATMKRLPADSNQFTGAVMRRLGTASASRTRRLTRWLAVSAAALTLGIVSLSLVLRDRGEPAGNQPVAQPTTPEAKAAARLVAASHASFFGELAPPLQSILETRRDYVLTEGLVELEFPSGASVIIESPAVFRVISDMSLALDTGRCSVHAPEGAEGFRVETPVTRVVDRGTRFTVSVAETNETEVQVIEGVADVYRSDAGAPAAKATPANLDELPPDVRLTEREAYRFTAFEDVALAQVQYTPATYRRSLPDRIIRYEAAEAAKGGVQELKSVTVQRGGREIQYPVEQLIPVELTWFKSADAVDRSGHLLGGEKLPDNLAELLSDNLLTTGVINPGGSKEPLTTDPVLAGDAGTPGFAVRFRKPVVNRPGPDVILMEVQTFSNPLDGDAFHVSPLKFAPGRKSHTIRRYDLTMNSPEALRLAPFSLYRYSQPIASLEQLHTATHVRANAGPRFQLLAVGIDLSDLGFAEGEQVEGLFFQDAEDDVHRVDPVYIAGFPEP
jgi:hypothetical protein